MRVHELSPKDMAKLVSRYLELSSPDTRKRVIPLIKDAVAEYENE